MKDQADPGPDGTPTRAAADERIAAEAAAWIVRRDRGLDDCETRALRAWERADPRHAAALARMGGTWRGLDRLPGDTALAAMADTVLARARARRRRRRWVNFATATAAMAAVAVVALYVWRPRPAPVGGESGPLPDNVRVLASTVNRMQLPDGSVAELNGTSRIELAYTAAERRVRLVDGEAHFIVAKNPDRPFFVTAGTVTVRAVGTAFNVRLASAAIEVLVTEGRVQLENAPRPAATAPERPGSEAPATPPPPAAPPALVAGQRAIIDRAAPEPAMEIGEVGQSEMSEALGWQGTRLVFSNTPLDEVVASFNRYNRHRLILGDPQLRARTLTGVFRADNLEGFVRLLRASVDVTAERQTPAETVLQPVR